MADTIRRMFISFVHEDEKVASDVRWLLERTLEVSAFMSSDRSKVYAGESWLEKITAALKESEIVLLMLSQRSVRRPWVNFEAGGAWLMGKRVIPCCYGNLTPGELPHPYGNVQAVQLPKDDYYLVKSVHYHLGLKPGEPISPYVEEAIRIVSDEKKKFWDEVMDPYRSLRSTLETFIDDPAVIKR